MAITVKHNKVSTIPDTDDTSLVRPSDWNADHTLVGTIDVANGGTGANTLTGYVKGNGTSAMTAVATVPSTDITGLGTMSTQNANAVAITGGTINGTTIGATTASTGAFTTATASTSFGSPIFKATSSAGGALQNSGGTNQLQWGGGGGNNLSLDVATNINPANAQVDISPTGTGTVRINPATAGTINNTSIGATTPAAGTFTTLTGNSTSQFGRSSANYLQIDGAAAGSDPVLSAQGSDTNIDLVLSPKGTGALQAQATTSTTAGGNARGASSVDLQRVRGSASQVASGQYSVVGGGNSNTGSAYGGFIGGGEANTASGYDSVCVAGASNQASAGYTFAGGGLNNLATGSNAVVVGGYFNTASGFNTFIGGGERNSGASSSAVTTQTTTTVTNGSTAVTLSGSNASIKVGQLIGGTGMVSYPNQTYVAAISGTSLTLSQNANASGSPTLSFYTPNSVVVGGGNNQATGSYSFIGGGGDAGTAANRNVASGDWSVVGGGNRNTASGLSSFVGGGGVFTTSGSLGSFPNTASGISSAVVGGLTNTASGQSSFVGSGYSNTANSIYGTVVGGTFGTTRSISGNNAIACCNAPYGGSAGIIQTATLLLGRQTTDATATALASDSSAAGSTNQVILPNNSAYFFRGEVVSGVTGGGDTKGWTIEGVIKRGANAAATTLVGVTVMSSYADVGAATWTIAVTADTTNGGLRVTFTGQASTTIRTVCQIRTTEMTY